MGAESGFKGSVRLLRNWLVDHEPDLTSFDNHCRNDTNGAHTYPPALLLKVLQIKR